MIVRVAGPGSMLGLYAALSHGVYEVSAESLTPAQLRPVERERFLTFLRNHKEAQMRAVQCICQEYRFALQDACRISLAETVAGRLGRLLLELARWAGKLKSGGFPGIAATFAITTDFDAAILQDRNDLEVVPGKLRASGAEAEGKRYIALRDIGASD